MNVGQFIFDVFQGFLSLKDKLYDFLFTKISVFGLVDFSLWQVLTGAVVVTVLIAVVVKCFI